jgi:6-phosphogluconolactonase
MIEDCLVAAVFPGNPVYCFFAFKFSQESRMLHKALVLALVVASLASCIGCSSTANNYVYATLPDANQVIAYREDPNSGVLTQIAGSPYSVGDGANSLVLHPSGKFLYVSNPGQNESDISLFTIATNGVLTEVFPRTSVAPYTKQGFLNMDPAGKFLYVANVGSNNISVFAIDSGTGALTPLTGKLASSTFTTQLPILNMQLTPSGNYLYISSGAGPGTPSGVVEAFSVTAGALQPIQPVSVFPTAGNNPNGLAIDPTGTFLYVANSSSNSISIFTIASTGSLSPVQNSPIDSTYTVPISLILDSAGKFLYVANQGSNNVAAYSISSTTGLPAILTITSTTGTTTTAFATESSPSLVALDPNGKYLFVGNQGTSAGIQSLVTSSGNLTNIFTYRVGNTPSSIAVLGK